MRSSGAACRLVACTQEVRSARRPLAERAGAVLEPHPPPERRCVGLAARRTRREFFCDTTGYADDYAEATEIHVSALEGRARMIGFSVERTETGWEFAYRSGQINPRSWGQAEAPGWTHFIEDFIRPHLPR